MTRDVFGAFVAHAIDQRDRWTRIVADLQALVPVGQESVSGESQGQAASPERSKGRSKAQTKTYEAAPASSRTTQTRGRAPRKTRLSDDDIIHAIAAAGKPCTAGALAESLGLSLSGIWSRLQHLVAEGRLTVGGKETYVRTVGEIEGRVN